MTKRALITGQDGSCLAEFLLGKGYEVHRLIRRVSAFNTARIDHLCVDLTHLTHACPSTTETSATARDW